MDYYFDTSALIELCKGADRDRLVEAIWKDGRLLLSAYNIAEFVQYENVPVRNEQLAFLKHACRNLRPFALPNDLCRYEADAYMTRQKQASLSIREDQEGIWIALDHPEDIDERARKEIEEHLKKQETWYKDIRQAFRQGIDDARALGLEVPKDHSTPLRWLRRYYDDPKFMQGFFAPLFEQCGYGPLCSFKIKEIFEYCETWKFNFGAIGLGLYLYGYPDQESSIDKQAGIVDTQQAAYLACADLFVTNDGKQFEIMELLLKCSTEDRHVLRYDGLRKTMLGQQ
jgi:hypothetical protein